jgi:HK97 family phage prohead protease
METRTLKIEVRAAKDDPNAIEGYAAVFNSESEDLGGFREVLVPGAFKRALATGDDVLCLMDHDLRQLLGRTSSGTCKVMEDENGLRFRCSMPNTRLGQDVMEQIKRGDISQCSFSFAMDPESDDDEDWSEEKDADGRSYVKRTIRAVSKLFDVSPVVTPAYRATSVSVA